MMREIAPMAVTSAEYVRESGGWEVCCMAYIAMTGEQKPANYAGFLHAYGVIRTVKCTGFPTVRSVTERQIHFVCF